jgi:hypothetical protein
MKLWYLLPFTLLAGLLIGRWTPSEGRRSEMPARGENTPQKNANTLSTITQMIQIPEKASKPRRRANVDTNLPPVTVTANELPDPSTTNAVKHRPHRERLSPEDLRARMEEAKELWRTRAELVRAQMFDKLNFQTAEQQTLFDNTINTMNQSLLNSMQGLATEIKNSPEMTTEQGIRVLAQMTTAMTSAYDTLFQAVPQDKQGEVGKMQMTDFIDPSVIEPLTDVQDKLQTLRPPRFHAE